MVKNWLVKLHESIQELQYNDDSVTGDMLILVSQKFEQDKGLYLGNNDESNETDEILYKKQNQRMAVQMMSHFFLHHKNLKKTKDSIWGMMTRTMKSMKSVSNIICICMFYHKGFYH